jgi:hypothetical protein
MPAPAYAFAADGGERQRLETPELSAGVEASLVRSMRPGRSAWSWSVWAALPLCALLGAYAVWGARLDERPAREPTRVAASAPVVPPAGFTITSKPPGADVVVDGKPLGLVTPAFVGELSPGLHSVELKLEGYLSASLPALLEAGQNVTLPSVELRSHQPPTAEVAEVTPRKPSVSERRVARRAMKQQRRQAAREARSAELARRVLVPNLDSETADSSSGENLATEGGTLQINSRPWARILVDGRFVGHTPQRALKLGPGRHIIQLVNEPLSMSKTIEVNIPAGETITRVETLDEDSETSSN